MANPLDLAYRFIMGAKVINQQKQQEFYRKFLEAYVGKNNKKKEGDGGDSENPSKNILSYALMGLGSGNIDQATFGQLLKLSAQQEFNKWKKKATNVDLYNDYVGNLPSDQKAEDFKEWLKQVGLDEDELFTQKQVKKSVETKAPMAIKQKSVTSQGVVQPQELNVLGRTQKRVGDYLLNAYDFYNKPNRFGRLLQALKAINEPMPQSVSPTSLMFRPDIIGELLRKKLGR